MDGKSGEWVRGCGGVRGGMGSVALKGKAGGFYRGCADWF